MPAARYPFVLTQAVGRDAYNAMVELVEERDNAMFERIDARFAAMTDRFERRLGEEGAALRVEMNGLRTEMARQHATLLKWTVVLWIGQTAAVVGIVTAIH